MREKIINIITGEESFRDYTSEEIAKMEKAQLETEEILLKEKEAAKAKAAILQKLGITEEEAKLLLS